ncbi:MAG: FAD-dependent oxidoreductase [Peptococcaceae bacterium BICA1-7]|nr:MAG: FAD-dependent oxidoreductase [Peptococcaceae bacterium BICA1-7]HBV95841.1 FAD-dependent oxidoreductase [Desulfotomaculum sp.]
MSQQLPSHAQIVIIGGGIVGCSTAYHLTKMGYKDVLLLERKELGSGTTWAAAGLVAQLRQNQEMTNLAKYATELYPKLEEETGVATGYVTTGALGVCQTEDRRREWLRGSAMAAAFGVEMYEVSLKEAEEMVPGMSTEGLVSAFYLPNDGQTNPLETAQALIKGARMRGAKVFENTRVTGIKLNNGTVCGVSTEYGDISCDYVINCAGMWGREIGKMAGVSIPLHAAVHMHAITKPIEGLKKIFPCVRDFDGRTYFKADNSAILFGGFEEIAKPWGMKGIPDNFKFTELPEDMDLFEVFMECGLERFPALETAEIRHMSYCAESFTPDNAFLVGEAPGVKNLLVACGMNSVGIASAAGAGRAIAQWINQGYPEEQLWPVDVRRYFSWQQNSKYVHDRVIESVGILYEHHYPNRQRTTARPVICSPVHDRLAQNGACFSMVAGWERADWFAPEGVEPVHQYSWGRANWFDSQGEEHRAIREGVGMYDLTSMHKYLLQGPDAEAALQKLCAGDVAVPVGTIVYTPILNDRGGFETDFTVTRIAEDTFFIVTAVGTGVRDFDYIKRRIPSDAKAYITDVTHGYTMLALMGPDARKVLSKLTDEDLSNEGFPFRTAREIDLGYARVWAFRISYVGELGWELYIPSCFATGVFDAIMEAGKEYNLRLVGMQAVNSLRMECGYRHWESDITPDDTPYEAGLGFCVKLDKGDFDGRAALIKQKECGITRRLVLFTLEDPGPMLYKNEPIFRNGAPISQTTSGAYGYTLGCSVAMGYLKNPEGITNDWILSGKYEILVEGKMYPARVHLRAPYDPKGERTKM